TVVDADVRSAALARSGHDIDHVVDAAVEVPCPDVDAAGEVRGIGEEAAQQRRRDRLTEGCAAEDLHVRAAAGASPGDDVAKAVAIHVAARHADAAGEVRAVGEEAEQLDAAAAVEDLDVRAAAFAGAGDDVGDTVVIHVGRGHVNTAAKVRAVGHE